MKCTECNKKAKTLHGERWSSKHGFVIHKTENLCDRCASKREGFKFAGELLSNIERKLQNESIIQK